MGRMLNLDLSRHSGYPAAVGTVQGRFRSPVPEGSPKRVGLIAPHPAASVPEADQSSFGKFAYRAGLAMLFVRMAALPDVLASLLHFNTYLLYLVGPPAYLGAIATGGIGRTLRHRAARCWLGFLICMIVALPFSTWVGGSYGAIKLYLLYSFPIMFVVGGLATNWREVRAAFSVTAAAGVLVIAMAGVLVKNDAEGRATMSDASTTIGNSNDLASLFVLLIPFLFYVVMDPRRSRFIRYSLIAPILYALKVILGTASRGAMVALAVMFIFVLFRASGRQKMVAIAGAGIAVAALPAFVNGSAMERLASMVGGQVRANSAAAEALQSQAERRYLLEQSIIATLKSPVFGIGPGEFANYVGPIARAHGIPVWNETHNSFTEVSSECGVPAMIFFTLGIAFAFSSVSKVHRKARQAGQVEITNTCFCYLAAMVGYVVTLVFLSNAYRFYLPAMIGLAVALGAAAEKELVRLQPGAISPAAPRRHAVVTA